MRLLICGSRTWRDQQKFVDGFVDCLARHGWECEAVIEGGARGADRLGRETAELFGIPVETYPADWSKNGAIAGLIRNREMLKFGKPDVVLAFWDGKSSGTKNMIRISETAGVPTEVVKP